MHHGLRQHLDVQQRGHGLPAGVGQRVEQLLLGGDAIGFTAVSRRQHGKIDRHQLAVELAALWIAEAEFGGVAVHAVFHLQVVDAAVGHVVEQHHVDLAAFLNRGDQFGMQHHERAVAHHCAHPRCGSASLTPARRSPRTPCRSSRIPRGSRSPRLCHTRCRSPGRLPAAATITLSAGSSRFSTPARGSGSARNRSGR